MAARLAPGEWVKYHALGNDYLVMDGALAGAPPTAAWVQSLCDRHHGVGSDGLLWQVQAPPGAEAALRIFNPDGSEAEKSGNGLRIFARYCYDFGHVRAPHFRVAVASEVVDCALLAGDGGPAPAPVGGATAQVASVRTSMGQAQFTGPAVGLTGAAQGALDAGDTRRGVLPVGGEQLDVTCVGLGNPHCVVFGEADDRARLLALGPAIERHPWFGRRINVQLVQVVDRGRLRLRIWERGAGETLASGSSSCAAAAAAYARGLVDGDVIVTMPGGEVRVTLAVARGADADGDALALTLTGPATPVARGTLIA